MPLNKGEDTHGIESHRRVKGILKRETPHAMEVDMKDEKKWNQNEDMSKEKKIDKAYARRHEVAWSEVFMYSILFAVLFFTLYMIEKFQ
jgi:hypothetical protein